MSQENDEMNSFLSGLFPGGKLNQKDEISGPGGIGQHIPPLNGGLDLREDENTEMNHMFLIVSGLVPNDSR